MMRFKVSWVICPLQLLREGRMSELTISTSDSGLTKSRGFAWPQVLCTGPVGIFSVVSRFDALERKCEKSLGVAVQIVRQPARRSDGFAIPRPDGLRFADRRNRL